MATIDVDIWVDLPARQYARVLAIAQKLDALIISGNVIGLRNDHRIDFLYQISGLKNFDAEWKQAPEVIWAGQVVRVLPLERIIRSKEVSNRPKDLIQLPALRDYLACLRVARPRQKKKT